MVLVLWPVAITGVLARTEPPSSSLLPADLKAFGLPQTMHTLDVHPPARPAQQHCDPPVPEPRPTNGQLTNIRNQPPFVIAGLRPVSLAGADLADRTADPSLRIAQPITKNTDRLPPAGWAYKFFDDISIASFKISISIR